MPSIGRAQAQLLRDRFLDTLGTEPKAGELPILEKVMAEAALEFIDAATGNLDKTASVSKGELATSLTFAVQILGETYMLSVGYPQGSAASKYWDFNNKGVQGVTQGGKAPNSPYKFRYLGVSPRHALAILKWYRHNGISARRVREPVSGLETKRKTLRESIKKADSLTSLAYATAMAMKRDGLKPSGYFDSAVKEVFGPELMDALAVALGGDIILKIRQYGDNI